MIFADKLILLRKKAGWSQEELAEQMDVTRQSVSKWEGAQSVPDLQKVIRLSQLFGVSTDYLLKDEIEAVEHIEASNEEPSVRRVSMEDANAFLAAKAETAKPVAYGVLLCILSPVCLFILGAVSEIAEYGISEDAAGGIGMVALLILVAAAVVIFISCGNKTGEFSYLEKERFETEYGVIGMVKERRSRYKSTYHRNNIIGTVLCITAVIPLFVGAVIDEENDLFMVIMLSFMFVIAGIGVVFLTGSGIVWASYERLLCEGDYSKEKKEDDPLKTAVYTVYWVLATGVYLGYSFITYDWERSWIVWVLAGVLFPAVSAVTNVIEKKKQ